MIPLQLLIFEQYEGKNREYYQGDNLLNHFELEQCEGATVFLIADFVGGHHQAVFKKGNEPTHQNKPEQPRFLKEFQVLEFQMAVPGDGHKNIGKQQKQDGVRALHGCCNGVEIVSLPQR